MPSSQPFRLMTYNPLWPQEFQQARSSILQATAGWLADVVHIGGTAVPGALSRPVVDMLAGINDLQALQEVCDLIEGLNYCRVETPAWCDDELCGMLLKPRLGEATHSVLVVRHEQELWQRATRTREQLKSDSAALEQLSQIKQEHYHASCSAPQHMEQAKDLFFSSLFDDPA